MRSILLTAVLGALLIGSSASAAPGLVGAYRIAEGPDIAGELVIRADGRFQYALAAGALDERAEGRWVRTGSKVCLHTEPKPVPPVFSKAAPIAIDGRTATLLVTWPNGRGAARVDFRIGFDTGDPLEGYTQYDGWSMPPGDLRTPRWIELSEPMHALRSPRFTLDATDRGTLHVVLVPNDLGVVNFEGACLEAQAGGFVLHREHGDMRLRRVRR